MIHSLIRPPLSISLYFLLPFFFIISCRIIQLLLSILLPFFFFCHLSIVYIKACCILLPSQVFHQLITTGSTKLGFSLILEPLNPFVSAFLAVCPFQIITTAHKDLQYHFTPSGGCHERLPLIVSFWAWELKFALS